MLETNKILQGNALDKLKELPAESINCCVTSPPYWALRDYGVEGQLGLEPTFDEYINNLCNIFDEVKRVLRKDGTLWVNLGDTYSGAGSGQKDTGKCVYKTNDFRKTPTKTNLPDKSLCNIPARFSIEMQNRGWILRNVIIWYKPNCMPSSVKDRFTVDFEYVYFFVKNKKYWFETQREAHIYAEKDKRSKLKRVEHKSGKFFLENAQQGFNGVGYHPDGRNKRCVWRVTTKPYKEAHFATYPKDLIEPMIKAGCPEFICNKCGNAREQIDIKVGEKQVPPFGGINHTKDNLQYSSNTTQNIYKQELSNCNCNAGFTGGIVLDPFIGSGTTAVVALEQNKKFIGIELNPEYIELAMKRIKPHLDQKKIFDY
jgi:DNA modification methylase